MLFVVYRLLFVAVISSTVAIVTPTDKKSPILYPKGPYSRFERVNSLQKSKEEETVREKEYLPCHRKVNIDYCTLVYYGGRW
jgi:hypothetical protein